MTLRVDLDLPQGALLPASAAPLGELVADANGIWFDFDPSCLAGRCLVARAGDGAAVPVAANAAPIRLIKAAGRTALATEARVNGGLVIDRSLPLPPLSIAATLAGSHGEPRTIAAIETGAGRVFHLTETGGSLHFGGRRGGATVTRPSPAAPDRPILVEAELGPDRLALAVDGGAPASLPLDPPPDPGEATVFIACRRQTPGLWNTLGALRLSDIVVLPGIALFETAALRAGLARHAR